MSVTVLDALVRIRPDFGNTMGSLSLVERGFALAIPLALAGTTAALVKMGMDAQTELSIVQGLTGSTAAQMQYYTTQLEGMGAKFGETLAESAKGLYYVVSAGFKGKDAIDVLTTAMQHAAATGTPLKDVANGLTSAMNSYGASANQAAYYSDIMTTAITYGKQTTGDFAGSVSKAALMAAAAHVPFTQLAAAESALTEKGEPASRAFTELSFLMSKTALGAFTVGEAVRKAGGHFSDAAYTSLDLGGKLLYLRDKTGLTTDELLKVVGGTRSARGALGLLTDSGAAYNNILEKMRHDSGVTAQAFQIHTHTMGYAFDKVKASVSNAGYELVKLISPTVIPLIGKLADAAGHLPDLFRKIGDGIGFVKTHMDIFGPVLTVAAGVIGGVMVAALTSMAIAAWAALAPMLVFAAPFLAVGAAIGLVVAALIFAYTHWKGFHDVVDTVRTAVGNFIGRIGDLLGVLGNVAGAILGFIGNIGPHWTDFWNGIQKFFSNTWNAIVGIVSGAILTVIGWFKTAYDHSYVFKEMVDQIAGVFKVAQRIFSAVWGAIVGFLQLTWRTIQQNASAAWQGFVGAIGLVLGQVGTAIGNVINAIKGPIGGLAGILGDLGGKAIGALIDSIKNGLAGIAAIAQAIASTLLTNLKNALGIHSPSTEMMAVGANLGMGLMAGLLGQDVPGQVARHLASIGGAAVGGISVGVSGGSVAGGVFPSGTAIMPSVSGGSVAGSAGGGGRQVIESHVHVYLDGREMAKNQLPHLVSEIRRATGQRL